MEDEYYELNKINRRRNEIEKRIAEKQRLMDLIKNKNTRNTTGTIDLFKKNKAVIVIQKAFRKFKERQEQKEIRKKERENAKYKFESDKLGYDMNYILQVIRIQKKFRHFLMVRNHQRIKGQYLAKLIQEYNKPITFERGVELRKELTKRLKTAKEIDKRKYEFILNEYYRSYKHFCESYDGEEELREKNWLLYFQSYDMSKFMESIDPDHLKEGDQRFKKFMLDQNKMPLIKKEIDLMERAYLNGTFADDINFDDTEERYLLDEIDTKYDYDNWKDILEGKK